MDLMRIALNLSCPSEVTNGDANCCRIFMHVNTTSTATANGLTGTTTSAMTLPLNNGLNELTIIDSGATFHSSSRYFAFWIARPACVFSRQGPYQFNSGATTSYSVSAPECYTDRLILRGFLDTLVGATTTKASSIYNAWIQSTYDTYANSSAKPNDYEKRTAFESSPFTPYLESGNTSRYISFRNIDAGNGEIGINHYGTGTNAKWLCPWYVYMSKSGSSISVTVTNSLGYNSAVTCSVAAIASGALQQTPGSLFSSSTRITVARNATGTISTRSWNQCFSKQLRFFFYFTNLRPSPLLIATFVITHTDANGNNSQSSSISGACEGFKELQIFADWTPPRDVLITNIAVTLSGGI